MKQFGLKNPHADIAGIGFTDLKNVYWNTEPMELVEHSIIQGEGVLNDTGALVVDTGEFTGRSPKDKFVVKDAITTDTVNWGEINIPITTEHFDGLYNKITAYFKGKDLYVRDSVACAQPEYRMNVRLYAEKPWQSLFAYNMFIRPSEQEIEATQPDWQIICASGFKADPATDGTRQHNFAVVNFTKRIILIGGTAYTGEIKKGIFSVLNYILPQDKNVLSMHCSANIGKAGDTAVFFGLSGTGKTTLSADPDRGLIGDDEHGWSDTGVFNFEGGCYAKCVGLTPETEPEIFAAVKAGSLLENTKFIGNTRTVDYDNISKTENTRVSYPLNYIPNAVEPSVGGIPKNIFFLTADAFGVLPPISKLTPGQAMYHFISGYTAKVAGTETGINEPKPTFSACFGFAFLPLHPTKYADMLGKKMKDNNVKVWLINTGWTGGVYGVGKRMKLSHTRAMITAALNGDFDNISFEKDPIFGLSIPASCPNVPSEVLHPRNTWSDKAAYDKKAQELADSFNANFAKFADKAAQEILDAAPLSTIKA